jgi:hypothetical protein
VDQYTVPLFLLHYLGKNHSKIQDNLHQLLGFYLLNHTTSPKANYKKPFLGQNDSPHHYFQ